MAVESGLTFQHVNGMSDQFYLAEIMGPGVALLDYDGDGDLDVYAVQGGALGTGMGGGTGAGASAGDRLYRNDLVIAADGTPHLRFTDVTVQSRIAVAGYGMGVAAGDVDNDGRVDLFVSRLGRNVLLRNQGDGTFADVSRTSGIGHTDWAVSASFVDYDRDGWLDLYVANYVEYRVESDTDCFAASGAPNYCSPATYRPTVDRLYRNRRNGTFEDVTTGSGIATAVGPGLGVVATDVNRDGWPDIYVANDGAANFLWMNQRNGTFVEQGLASGAALSGDGKPEGSMGVAAADVDDDGDDDLFMTHIAGEGHNLYVNDGSGVFEDRSTPAGLSQATLALTGFGGGWIDVDNDGTLEIFAASGAIQPIPALVARGDPYPLAQPMQLLRRVGERFADASAQAGAPFAVPAVGRGVALGDVDNDGDTDIVVAHSNGPLRLLRNNVGQSWRWLGLRFVDRPNGRDLVGARVEVQTGGTTRWRRAHADGSYASSSDPRVIVGLGQASGTSRVRVTWPDGVSESWNTLAGNRYHTLVRGTAAEGSGR